MEFRVKEFCDRPSLEQLTQYPIKKDEWRYIAQHYEVSCPSSATKEVLKNLVIEQLVDQEILPAEAIDILTPASSSASTQHKVSKDIMDKPDFWTEARLQYEHRKLELEAANEAARIRLEERKLDLRENRDQTTFNLVKNIPLVPEFNEVDPEGSLQTFEKSAIHFGWPRSEWTWLLQAKLTGKAAIIVANLDCVDDYDQVKQAILTSFAITPDGYRQKFRSLQKNPQATYVEFITEELRMCNKWLSSLAVTTFQKLRDLVVMEDFKRKLPFDLRIYIEEKGEVDLIKVAQLADSYTLVRRTQSNIPRNDKVTSVKSSRYHSNADKSVKVPYCNYCKQSGHNILNCRHPSCKKSGSNTHSQPSNNKVQTGPKPVNHVATSVNSPEDSFTPFKSKGTVSLQEHGDVHPIIVLRDTGASQSIIYLPNLPEIKENYTGERVLLRDLSAQPDMKLAKVFLQCELYNGEAVVAVNEAPLPVSGVNLILGNDLAGKLVYPEVHVVDSPLDTSPTLELDQKYPHIFPACAVTRSKNASMKIDTSGKALPFDQFISQAITKENLIKAQQCDPSLAQCRKVACDLPENHKVPCFYLKDRILMRVFRSPHLTASESWSEVHQIVVPSSVRKTVLELAHDGLAGHQGIRRTYRKILEHYFWPGVKKDVIDYVKTCHVCQVVGKPNQPIPPAPLEPIPVLAEPFERIVIDCVGPLPRTKKGNQYLLTVMDTVTRYPEVYPLKTVSAKNVVRCLLNLFTVFGFPKEIQSDQGSNFTSNLHKEVLNLLNISHKVSTAYHPQSQGCLERFHQTFKSVLKKYCLETQTDWDDNIGWLLFAIRECPQESLGYSPFEVLYGRQIRGPLKVLKDKWLSVESSCPKQTVSQYVTNLKSTLLKVRKVAMENFVKSQKKMKSRYDVKAKIRLFNPGDKVLLFLPVPGSPLRSKYHGPYIVSHRQDKCNYVVYTPDRRKDTQMVHVNLLKAYEEKSDGNLSCPKPVACVSSEKKWLPMERTIHDTEEDVGMPSLGNPTNKQVLSHIKTHLSYLSEAKTNDVISILQEVPEVTADTPGSCNHTLHDVQLVSEEVRPIRQRAYRLNPEKMAIMKKEVDYLLEHGLAEPSNSPWASPSLLVPKPDGTFRLCVDYRKVNQVTIQDSYPLPLIDDLVDAIGKAKFLTKIDLQKGYYQIGLTEKAKLISAFITTFGLFQFKVMPFGMCNAPATFQRSINYILHGLEGVSSYLDDLLVKSDTWIDHIARLRSLFLRLAEAGFTINLAKSTFGNGTVTYLGHVVGQGLTRPKQANVEAIVEYPTPNSRKSLMRFLGMVGYYRRFCSNLSSIAAPLTDMTSSKRKFQWNPDCEAAFQKLKLILITKPVLCAPNYSLPFMLQIDASANGVGGVLLQEDPERGVKHPISYYSAKLKKHQESYSTIEKECLSLILALKKFECYLPRGKLITVFTDHNPLTFLHRMQHQNQRILRWALQVQPYRLEIKHIKGVDNVIADPLSRDLPLDKPDSGRQSSSLATPAEDLRGEV